jgi:chromosome segregation ATPase
VADQRCINASLQEKWISTKDALAHANGTIATLNGKLTALQVEYSVLSARFAEGSAMAEQDVCALRTRAERKLEDAQNEASAAMERTVAHFTVVVEDLTKQLEEARSVIAAREREVTELSTAKAALENELESTKVSINFDRPYIHLKSDLHKDANAA